MKLSPLLLCAALGTLVSLPLPTVRAAGGEPAPAAAPAAVEAEIAALMERLAAKLRGGEKAPADFAEESAAFDALLAKYRGLREAEAAILLNRGAFTSIALKDEAAAKAIFERLARDYAGTKEAGIANNYLTAMTPEAKAARQARADAHSAKVAALRGQPAAEIEFTWSTRVGLKKLSDLRGNVVVLDFWATWCGPCIATFPQVRKEVEHFRDSPVVFLGVTSLQGKVHRLEAKLIDVANDPQREYDLTAEFKKKFEMTWDIAFSAERVFNPHYAVQGIPSVSIIAPDGTLRHVALHPGADDADIAGKVTALLKEFGLPAATH